VGCRPCLRACWSSVLLPSLCVPVDPWVGVGGCVPGLGQLPGVCRLRCVALPFPDALLMVYACGLVLAAGFPDWSSRSPGALVAFSSRFDRQRCVISPLGYRHRSARLLAGFLSWDVVIEVTVAWSGPLCLQGRGRSL
jgi:hypothetical protein